MTKMLFFGLSLILAVGLQAQTVEPAPASKATPTAKEAPATGEQVEAPALRAMPKEQRAERIQARRDALVEKLNLTAEQTEQFDAINSDYRQQMRELRLTNGNDRRAIGQQMRELRQAQNEEIKGILTPEQVVIFEAETAAPRTRTKN